MYKPTDTYIQKSISNGIKLLNEALEESTDKAQTAQDILNEFKKQLFDPDDPNLW